MPQTHILTESKYARLVRDIRRLIEEGKARAARAAGRELVVMYWHVGRRICEEGLTENAGYGAAILDDLGEELGIDPSTLLRCMHFFQTYKTATSSRNLTWSHYKYLLAIEDTQKRKWYEALAERESLQVLQLSRAIKEDRYEQNKPSKSKKKTSARLNRPTQATYVYKAFVERVIDGDTLLLKIDLGFTVFKEQRLRLADIDTPAMDEPGGREAYRFVRDRMAQVEFVMVKTNKIDIYGRYVGHVFYSPTEQDKVKIFSGGRYLNQELVDKGLAVLI